MNWIQALLIASIFALVVFLLAVMQYTAGVQKHKWPVFPLMAAVVATIWWFERGPMLQFGPVRWETAALESIVCLWAGWLLWRAAASHRGHGVRLLAGGFFISALNGMDRWQWPHHPLFLLRVAFDHFSLVAIGIAMVVLMLERARARSEELNDKMRRLTLLIAASTMLLNLRVFWRWAGPARLAYNLFGDLSRWSAPEWMVWLLLASGFGLFIPVRAISDIALNGFICIAAVYFCQGLAIIGFYFQSLAVPSIVRGIIYFVVFAQPFVAALVGTAGVFDMWIDFRRLKPPSPEANNLGDFF